MYKVVIEESIKKDLKGVSKMDIAKIYKRIKSLENLLALDSLKLVNSEIYRIRQGNYRIFFEVDFQNEIITVFKISHRKDAY
ncbi:MAG: type II toxin-antitoxin system RelE/ParE family toxin [Leptospiraceae bacterium]|nr:type II toxin-antitoxin system RelE/ParE family toxin [Leptospiraceae bacterium]